MLNIGQLPTLFSALIETERKRAGVDKKKNATNQLTELCPSCVAQWNCKYVIKEGKIKDNNASLEVSCTLKMEKREVDKKMCVACSAECDSVAFCRACNTHTK